VAIFPTLTTLPRGQFQRLATSSTHLSSVRLPFLADGLVRSLGRRHVVTSSTAALVAVTSKVPSPDRRVIDVRHLRHLFVVSRGLLRGSVIRQLILESVPATHQHIHVIHLMHCLASVPDLILEFLLFCIIIMNIHTLLIIYCRKTLHCDLLSPNLS